MEDRWKLAREKTRREAEGKRADHFARAVVWIRFRGWNGREGDGIRTDKGDKWKVWTLVRGCSGYLERA